MQIFWSSFSSVIIGEEEENDFSLERNGLIRIQILICSEREEYIEDINY